MQGGIRRGNDLLPRYNTQGHGRSKGGWLTTPMKKIIVYVLLLFTVFVVIQTVGIGKDNEQLEYELERTVGSSGINRDALESQMDIADAILEKAGSAAGKGKGTAAEADVVDAAGSAGSISGAGAGSAVAAGGSVGSAANSISEETKEKFNEDLVAPQDLSNSAPAAVKNAKNSKSGVGNDVKADIQGTKGIDKKAQEIKEAAPYKKDG
ncbi:unnamed protein product [Kluyveromyces dobzhanskii CBS 2104]|uniref:WGS project CCBQ000000000 data, contig 00058 n=1 Tax=Kluyveromyces dobzhanskii CBS 2104 TaxID=1427455 RepID=A0A0A8LCA2_9SACH|nr:unnamed protein product [Kluyveromyces dobzhanskii CBS 2104]